MTTAKEAAKRWIERDPESKELVEDLLQRGDLEAFEAERLSFGTAGLRGLMGIGNGRMNVSSNMKEQGK